MFRTEAQLTLYGSKNAEGIISGSEVGAAILVSGVAEIKIANPIKIVNK